MLTCNTIVHGMLLDQSAHAHKFPRSTMYLYVRYICTHIYFNPQAMQVIQLYFDMHCVYELNHTIPFEILLCSTVS